MLRCSQLSLPHVQWVWGTMPVLYRPPHPPQPRPTPTPAPSPTLLQLSPPLTQPMTPHSKDNPRECVEKCHPMLARTWGIWGGGETLLLKYCTVSLKLNLVLTKYSTSMDDSPGSWGKGGQRVVPLQALSTVDTQDILWNAHWNVSYTGNTGLY